MASALPQGETTIAECHMVTCHTSHWAGKLTTRQNQGLGDWQQKRMNPIQALLLASSGHPPPPLNCLDKLE